MSFSGTNARVGSAFVGTAVGCAGYALPLLGPWPLFLFLGLGIAGWFYQSSREARFMWFLAAGVGAVLILTGYLSAPLGTSLCAAILLAQSGYLHGAAKLLILNVTLVATIEALAANFLHGALLECLAPALITAVLFSWGRGFRLAPLLVAMVGSLALAQVGMRFEDPVLAMTLAAIPASTYAALRVSRQEPGRDTQSTLACAAVAGAALLLWACAPPRTPLRSFVLLPDAPTANEAHYFSNYAQLLSAIGVKVELAARPEEIPEKSLVLMPWMTSPFSSADKSYLQTVARLANSLKWTVVLAGEHNNYGGVQDRVSNLLSHSGLRKDLTVPPGNLDVSGPLRAADIRGWPHRAILNRGASVEVKTVFDRVLLAGDGWWSEPDIGEWLWTGDYVWQRGDRAGRLVLASATDIGAARYVIVGDNSFLMNSQVVADPRPLLRLLSLSTLWPALTLDLLVLTAVALILFRPFFRHLRSTAETYVLAAVCIVVAAQAVVSAKPGAAWYDIYVSELGFAESNFNETLARHPDLLDIATVKRASGPLTGAIDSPAVKTVIFAHIDGAVRIGDVRIDDCYRLGSLKSSQGPYLMDAQACSIHGDARPVIGSKEEAAAVEIGNLLLVLDTKFLSQRAPDENALWLKQLLRGK